MSSVVHAILPENQNLSFTFFCSKACLYFPKSVTATSHPYIGPVMEFVKVALMPLNI